MSDPILQLESRLDAWTRTGAAMARELATLKAKASAPPAPPEPLPELPEVEWWEVKAKCENLSAVPRLAMVVPGRKEWVLFCHLGGSWCPQSSFNHMDRYELVRRVDSTPDEPPPAPPEPLPSLGEVARIACFKTFGSTPIHAWGELHQEGRNAWEACAAAVLAEHARRTKREPSESEVEETARMMRREWHGDGKCHWDGLLNSTKRDWRNAARAVLRRERGLDA